MARTDAAAAANANTSKKRKTTDDAEELSGREKRPRGAAPTTNGTTTEKTASKAKATTKKTAGATTKKPTTVKKETTVTTKKTATTKAKPAAQAASKTKAKETKTQRKPIETADEATDGEATEVKKPKTTKTTKAAKPKKEVAPPAPKPRKNGPVINERSKDVLTVYVFGENSSGELGLGAEGNVKDVKRPRTNRLLEGKRVVQIAAGGMHQVFLTDDGNILTCGVNDQGALGRNTAGAEEDDDTGLNPNEATPIEVDLSGVAKDTVFTSVAAGDSITLVVTDEGLVYGCGTFRSNEGVLGFTPDIQIQRTLTLIPGVKNIKKIACGSNHALALDKNGAVWAWGSGQQNQLGRRVIERNLMAGLTPREFGLPKKKIVQIGSGAYHGFAIDKDDKVWTWGLNSYGECGIEESAGKDDAIVEKATVVDQLSGRGVIQIDGGAHHSLAVTSAKEALVWGRTDGFQVGIDISTVDDDSLVRDDNNKPRILKKATVVKEVPNAIFVAANSDQSFIIDDGGHAYSAGFSVNYQTGLGTTDDVEEFTVINEKSAAIKPIVFAGAGGQYGVLANVDPSA